jgi:DNA-nicking Smr family endonuclease
MGDHRHEEEGDGALFLAAVADGRPLGDRARVAPPVPPGRSREHAVPALAIDAEASTGRARGLAAADLDRLAAGRIRPEADVDLHGMSEDAAAGALERFLASARAAGRRCVLVVTGKGLHSNGAPILRHAVPSLLADRLAHHVDGFAPARPADGGDGALYVLLARTPPRGGSPRGTRRRSSR